MPGRNPINPMQFKANRRSANISPQPASLSQPQIPSVSPGQQPSTPSATGTQPKPYDAWANIGTSDAQATWQKMYDNEAAKTQRQNAQQSAMASRNAAQQAAIGGYNPQAGARLHDVITAGANRANQSRNESLQNLNLQTQSMIANDKDQRTQSAIEEISRINPNAGAAARRAAMTGGDINAALQPFYDQTGQIKAYGEREQAIDERTSRTRDIQSILQSQNDPRRSAAIEGLSKEDLLSNKDLLAQINSDELNAWADKNGLYKTAKDIRKIPRGEKVVYNGRMYELGANINGDPYGKNASYVYDFITGKEYKLTDNGLFPTGKNRT